ASKRTDKSNGLIDELFHCGSIWKGKLSYFTCPLRICKIPTRISACLSDKAGFNIPRMRLGKVLVLAHQDDGLGPEALRITAFFIRTVEAQPVADGLGLADVSDPSVGVFLVLAKKDVD